MIIKLFNKIQPFGRKPLSMKTFLKIKRSMNCLARCIKKGMNDLKTIIRPITTVESLFNGTVGMPKTTIRFFLSGSYN